MQIVDIVQVSIDYIENNLKTDITVDELASVAGYSKYHYSRIFKSLTGLSVMEYINRRRLIHSAFEISNGGKVIDTALVYGFETNAGYYKAFVKEFGCSPTEFINNHIASKPCPIKLVQEEHIMITHKKLKKVLASWDMSDSVIKDYYHINTDKKSENIWIVDNDFFLKVTTNKMALEKQFSISKTLNNHHILTAMPIKNTDNKLFFTDGELYFWLSKRIDANPLKSTDFYGDDQLCFEVGKAIGTLDLVLLQRDELICNDSDIAKNVINKIDSVKVLANLTDDFCDKLKDKLNVISTLPTQIIHRDLNPENILMNNNQFGFVDFEILERNIRIFDICYCATAILSETFKNVNCDNSKWFDILDNLIEGYDSVINLSNKEKQAIPYIIYAIQIICIDYFSKYEKYNELTKTNIDMLKFILHN